MSLVQVRNLGQTFEKKKSKSTVFENLDFEIQKGEFITLLGPSGCGKSTLLRLLGGLLSPSQGEIHWSEAPEKAFVFQEPRLLPWRTCVENVLLPVEIRKGQISKEDQERASNLLSLFKIPEALHHFPHELSGGMKMRNSIARSLILDPQFLLLDEPFAALDETTRLHFQAEFRELYEKRKWTVVLVTHSIEEACFFSSRILLFSRKRKGLIEIQSKLPSQRNANLRDRLEFFEETKAVRALFEQESLG